MEQELCVGGILQQERTSSVPLAVESEEQQEYSICISSETFMDEAVRSRQSFHSSGIVGSSLSHGQELLIRAFDILGSVVLLILAMPVMIIVALMIKLFCGGQVLYKQKRVGKQGKIFTLYKFRTMVDNSEDQTGPVWAERNDPRVTSIGRFLRRTRLDEFPQLFNVFCGDMSLVGPRPERPHFVRQYEALRGMRLAIKPGLTGLAQIRNTYDLKPQHKTKYDHLYIRKRCLLLNMYILLKTVPVVIFCRNGW
jgi:lipopolysaccharide/colanic/teichoic acid biosynthesis glycosyltransferase